MPLLERHGETYEVGRGGHEDAGPRIAGIVDRAHRVRAVARIGCKSRKVGRRAIRDRIGRGVGHRIVHGERIEDLLSHERLERFPRGGFDGRAHQDPSIARIAKLRAGLEQQRLLLKSRQCFDRPFAVLREQRALVAAVGPDAGQMPHQLAQGHRPLFFRKRRHVGLNLIVQVQAAPLEQQADSRRRKRDRGCTDPELRIRRDGGALLEIGQAKAFGPHDVATNPDGHRQARQVLLGDPRANELPPLLHGVGPPAHRGELRNGSHLLRARMQRRRRGLHVLPEPENRGEQEPDGDGDRRERDLFPTS